MEWKTRSDGGATLEGSDFSLSYQPAKNVTGPDDPNGETALIFQDDAKLFGRTYWILKGDWREAYAEIAPQGLKALQAFYKAHDKHRSKWSEDKPYIPTEEETIEIITDAMNDPCLKKLPQFTKH